MFVDLKKKILGNVATDWAVKFIHNIHRYLKATD